MHLPFAAQSLASHLAIFALLLVGFWRMRRWPYLFALMTWPGTLAHELLHYLMGVIFGARPVSLSIIPRKQADGSWLLGEVAFTRLRWWNSLPVGLAPLALLPLGGWILWESLLLPAWTLPAAGYQLITVQCLLAGWPSKQDFAHVLRGLLTIAILGLLGLLFWQRVMPG
jgi:hypothetical protein